MFGVLTEGGKFSALSICRSIKFIELDARIKEFINKIFVKQKIDACGGVFKIGESAIDEFLK